jgi:flavin-dependent thymidylate synthase
MKNKIELIGVYGDDETIACSAWTSTSRKLTEEKRNRIPQMLETLWTNGHETPFEKGIVHFLVDSEIASHIHMLKHRIASINGESARYKELKEDKFYLPEDWIGINPKEPNVLHEYINGDWYNILKQYNELGNELYHQCLNDLTPVLGRKRAKESARFFKTYSSQIEVDIMFNMRSFANFMKLRDSEHAQKEIREIAQEMFKQLKELPNFKYTLELLEKYTIEQK